jgi:hypothetical protein
MTQADRVLSTPPPDTSPSFAALAAAVHPAWHQAIIRLANATQNVSDKLDLLFESSGQDMRLRTRELIESLVNYLDLVDGDRDFEDEGDREEIGDAEPSLGSFDRMANQDKSWRQGNLMEPAGYDCEKDDCDSEDDDPEEAKQQPPEMGGAA